MRTTTNNPLEAAMAAVMAPSAPKAQPKRMSYAEARADLDARARAGQTVQGRNNKGQFLRGAKVFTVGAAPVAPVVARKIEKVAEAPRPARRAPASAALSAEV